MNTIQISEDLETCNNLPDDNPYFERFLPQNARHGKPLLLGDKLALIGNDPAFEWNLACCYFEARQPMPVGLCRHVAFRAYVYLKNRGRIGDTDLARAYAVQQRPRQRDLWRAFLVTGASFDQVAAFLEERVQVIRLFSQLFWNVGRWLKDGTYMTDLLRLNTVEPVDPALALMRFGYAEGALRLARTVGLAQGASSPESMAEQYDRLERRIVSRANVGMDYGLDGPKANPTLRGAQALLLARKKLVEQEQDEDMRRGLGGMSLSVSVNEEVQKIFQGDVDRRVALQFGQMTKEGRETQAKGALNAQVKTSGGARGQDKPAT